MKLERKEIPLQFFPILEIACNDGGGGGGLQDIFWKSECNKFVIIRV